MVKFKDEIELSSTSTALATGSSTKAHNGKKKEKEEEISYKHIIDSLYRGTQAEKRAFGAVMGQLVGDNIGYFLLGGIQVDDKMILDAMRLDREKGKKAIKEQSASDRHQSAFTLFLLQALRDSG